VISGASLLLALVSAELVLRLFAPVRYRGRITAQGNPENLIHRASAIAGLAYELVPGVDRSEFGYHVVTNHHGLRSPPTTVTRSPGVLRIAAVGDSLTFGIGVDNDSTWPRVVERTLAAVLEPQGLHCEVINFGVTGYSSNDEAKLIEGRVLAFAPDLIVIGYYLNDPEYEPIQQLHRLFHEPLWWEHSHLLRLLSMQQRLWDLRHAGGGDLFRMLHLVDRPQWKSVLHAFEEIHRSCAAKHVPVLVAVLPTSLGLVDPSIPAPPPDDKAVDISTPWTGWADYPYREIDAQVVEAAERAGFEGFDLFESVSGAGFRPAELRYDDDHPNAEGHRLIGRAIATRILAGRKHLLGLD
jgi:lysophospholipase L1-like esterase